MIAASKLPFATRMMIAAGMMALILLIVISQIWDKEAKTGVKEPAARLLELPIARLDGGGKIQLSKWRGKVMIVNFWASWCGPCQYEIPHFRRWQNRFARQGLQIAGIGLDKPEKLKNTARSLSINYPLLIMPMNKGRTILHGLGNDEMKIPFSLIYDRDGSLAFAHKGIMGKDEFDLLVAPLL